MIVQSNVGANTFRVFISGSVHLDIISKITDFQDRIDKAGEISLDVGGTAYNVAMNLQFFGIQNITFYTAMRPSPISQMLIKDLHSHNISTLVSFDKALPQSGFSAHFIDDRITGAVSSTSVEKYNVQITPEVEEAIQQADVVILDCNHSEASLKTLAEFSKACKKQLVLCGVSEGKVLRAAEIPFDFLFLNRMEYKLLLRKTQGKKFDSQQHFVVTDGEAGASIYIENKQIHHEPANRDLQPNGVVFGSGDAFCAGFVHAYFILKLPMLLAIQNGNVAATRLIQKAEEEKDRFHKHLQNLKNQAERDHLTGLLTRASGLGQFQDMHKNFAAAIFPYSVIMIDLDHFKKVNDEFGHPIGDLVLKKAAEVISSCRRQENDEDLAIRWGGEEFVVILTSCKLADATTKVAQRILNELRAHIFEETGRCITGSIGVAEAADGESLESAIERADQLAYQAKENGRNQVRSQKSIQPRKKNLKLQALEKIRALQGRSTVAAPMASDE